MLRSDWSPLDPDLRDRILERLGFSTPPTPDPEDLRALYKAWCENVPFDNVRKMIALRTSDERPLPGGHAEDFFVNWLADHCGGTCWPTSNALFELARSLGFDTRRIVGCMRDLGIVNHASVVIRTDGRDWLVDSSLLYNVPLPLDQRVFMHSDAVIPAEVEPLEGGQYLLWVDVPPNSGCMACRLRTDEVSHALYLASYEASRDRSPFNQRLYARRNRPGELLMLVGNTRFSKTTAGTSSRDLSPSEVKDALREDIGISESLIDRWVRSGSLDASFEPPSGPKPPSTERQPPSRRSSKPLP